MNVRVLLVFCGSAIIQIIHAAPRETVPFEVNASTGNVGFENALTQNAAAGDVMLKTPEPLSATTSSSFSDSNGSDTVGMATSLGDDVSQGITDHLLPVTTTTAATNLLNGNPPSSSASASASSSSFPTNPSTTATSTSPLDNEMTFASGPATTTGLTVADPMLVYKMITNMLRRQEQLMQSLYSPFAGMIPNSIPMMRPPAIRIPNTNDPSLKLVDKQVINEGDVKGKVETYEGRPDPNTLTKMQTSEFSVNKDGLQGSGQTQHYVSSSSSSSSGGNPSASVGTFFSGIPTRFNMGLPSVNLRFL